MPISMSTLYSGDNRTVVGYYRSGIVYDHDNQTARGYFRNGVIYDHDNHTARGYYRNGIIYNSDNKTATRRMVSEPFLPRLEESLGRPGVPLLPAKTDRRRTLRPGTGSRFCR